MQDMFIVYRTNLLSSFFSGNHHMADGIKDDLTRPSLMSYKKIQDWSQWIYVYSCAIEINGGRW